MIGCIENESPKKDEWHVPSIEPSELNKPVSTSAVDVEGIVFCPCDLLTGKLRILLDAIDRYNNPLRNIGGAF